MPDLATKTHWSGLRETLETINDMDRELRGELRDMPDASHELGQALKELRRDVIRAALAKRVGVGS